MLRSMYVLCKLLRSIPGPHISSMFTLSVAQKICDPLKFSNYTVVVNNQVYLYSDFN